MKRIPIFLVLSLLCCCTGSYAQSYKSPQKGLVAYYPFNADADDNSGNRNHGVLVGGVTPVEDRFGNECSAMHFDGINGYISVPSSRTLESPRSEITITSWFKLDPGYLHKGLKWVTVCCKSNLPTENAVSPQYRLQLTELTLSMNTDFTEETALDMDYGEWYFYAMVYDGNRVTAYLNDRKVFDYYYDKPLRSDTYNLPLEIGRDIPGDPEYFYGTLDDIMIYNRALSTTEIDAIYRDKSESVKKTNPCQQQPEAQPEPNRPNKPNREIRRADREENTSPQELQPEQVIPDEEIAESPKPRVNIPPNAQDENSTPPIDPNKYEGTYPPMRNPGANPGEVLIFKGDTVDFQKTITVGSPDIKIYPYDHQKEDGDIVSININGVWVVNKYRLKKKTRGHGRREYDPPTGSRKLSDFQSLECRPDSSEYANG